MRVWMSLPVGAGIISSASEASAPFAVLGDCGARDRFFRELEFLRAPALAGFRGGLVCLALAGFFGPLAFAAFFGDGRAPPRACFLG
jgi:hypothetical protein